MLVNFTSNYKVSHWIKHIFLVKRKVKCTYIYFIFKTLFCIFSWVACQSGKDYSMADFVHTAIHFWSLPSSLQLDPVLWSSRRTRRFWSGRAWPWSAVRRVSLSPAWPGPKETTRPCQRTPASTSLLQGVSTSRMSIRLMGASTPASLATTWTPSTPPHIS